MKTIISACLLFGVCFFVKAQSPEIKYPALDASPMDAVYFPLNAAKVKAGDNSVPIIKVLYSRPQLKGREIFGVLEPFDKVWRLGANENTEIYFTRSVTIGGKKVKKGVYSLFTIPKKDKWIIIVNKMTDKWGAFAYDSSKDLVRVEVPITKLKEPLEALSMTFTETESGANLCIAWDTVQVALPIFFNK